MRPTYEHHFEIRQNPRAPFKYATEKNALTGIYNWHENIEILLITSGKGTVRYGSEEIPAHPDDIFIINSDVFHQVNSTEGIDFSYLIVDESFCKENGLPTEKKHFDRHIRDDTTRTLYCAVADLAAKPFHDMTIPKMRYAVLALMIHLCSHHTLPLQPHAKKDALTEQYIKRTVAHIAEHFAEPQTLAGLAAVSGISPCHLARIFKQYTGETVFTHLQTVRCRHAEAALLRGASVTEAAEHSGFDSLPFFSRTYKRIIGHPPSKTKRG